MLEEMEGKDYTVASDEILELAKGLLIYSKNFVDDYFVIDGDDTADFRIGTDTLESGKNYTLLVTAESAYHLYSTPLRLSFTAQ